MVDFFNIKNNLNIKTRESGVELLRILSMFFVIIIHEIFYFLPSDNLFVAIGRVISWPAIFCFAFITGYFLILKNDQGSKIKRFLFLTLEIVIWRILISLIYLIAASFIAHDSVANFFYDFFVNVIIDLISPNFWYFWAIIFVYLIFPFFASFLDKNYKNGKQLLKWILWFFFMITIIATLGHALIKVIHYNFSAYTDWATFGIVMFPAVLGGYWHLIEQEKRWEYNSKMQLYGVLGLVIVYLINFSWEWWMKDGGTARTYLNPLWTLAGWFYFLIFKGFKFHNKFINWWSDLSWWIYVLHQGFIYLWASTLMSYTNLDNYSRTILTILICYFLTIILVLATQNFDRFIFKPFIWEKWKKWFKTINEKRKQQSKLQEEK